LKAYGSLSAIAAQPRRDHALVVLNKCHKNHKLSTTTS
jgi:hypothetical protein